jgi:hypothetical protein
MKSLRIITIMASLVVGGAQQAAADVSATVLMRSGERVTGNLEALDGGILFVRTSRDDQRKLPFPEVALIDMVGGAQGLPETELREARGAEHLLLERSGNSMKGRLLDVEGGRGTSEGTAARLTFVFRTQGGEERRLPTDGVARVYLGNFPGEAPAATPPTSTDSEPALVPGAVRVAARQRWVDSGITVLQDQTVSFGASGEVRLSSDAQDTASPAGSKQGRRAPNAPIPGALAGALIGRVGNSQPFGIGDQAGPLRMPAAGRLYLSVNDDELSDNSGAFQVTVTPAAATAAGRRRRP